MKKFLMFTAFLALIAVPVMAEDAATEAQAVEAVAVEAVPVEGGTVVETAVVEVDAEANAACVAETNEKVKLPEVASEAEQAQWDAALAECLKGTAAE